MLSRCLPEERASIAAGCVPAAASSELDSGRGFFGTCGAAPCAPGGAVVSASALPPVATLAQSSIGEVLLLEDGARDASEPGALVSALSASETALRVPKGEVFHAPFSL